MDADVPTFQRWMNRHLVSLVLIYWHLDKDGNSTGEPRVNANSCFIMAFGDMWFLVTAGHVVEDLNKLIAHPFVKVVDTFLVDSLGLQAAYDNNIPFDYEDSARYYEYHDGLDFALICLGPNHRRLLQANGVEPVGVENWIRQDISRCKGFVLLGIPAELVKQEDRAKPGIVIGSVMLSLKRLETLPEGSEVTEYERFIGDLMNRPDLKSLGGVSGGPIVGFYDEDGDTRYWVIAVQSHCLDNHYVFGCPLNVFGPILLNQIKELAEMTDEERTAVSRSFENQTAPKAMSLEDTRKTAEKQNE